MKTIVYLHGFLSSPQSAKATALARAVAALPPAIRPRLSVPALFHDPAVAMATVRALVEADPGSDAGDRLTFVGSSLGGFYANHLAEHYGSRAVLINPAIRPYEDLKPHLGPQANYHTGETFVVTPEHFAALARLRVDRITRPERYFLLVQTGDEVLDWRAAVAHYPGAWQHVEGGGDHAYQGFEARISEILRFAGVDRPRRNERL